MTLHTEWVNVNVGDQHLTLYTAKLKAAKTPLPAVIVIQEIFGPDYHIQDVVERFAKAGYFAVAPDLFTVEGKRPAPFAEDRIEEMKGFLDRMPPSAWHDQAARDEALAKETPELAETFANVMGSIGRGHEFVATLRATVQYLQETNEATKGQKVGTVGYCMGGALSAAMACNEPALSGAVIYYGRLPQESDVIQNIACPVLGIFAEQDPGINATLDAFKQATEEHGKTYEQIVYEGAGHGFFNDTRSNYDAASSREAWVKTLSFFREVLA